MRVVPIGLASMSRPLAVGLIMSRNDSRQAGYGGRGLPPLTRPCRNVRQSQNVRPVQAGTAA
jgi:hypothetical protein